MAKYRIAVALLIGAGFTSAVLLLIKLSTPSGIALLLALLLLPGSAIANLAVRSQEIGPPLIVLAANAVVYAAVSFVGLSIFGRGITAEKMRLATIRLLFPVAILIGLSCVPALNPLWPRGLEGLSTQERELQQAVPLGMDLDVVRSVLRSKGIQFREDTETSQTVVLDDGRGLNITAAAGEHVVSARLQTEARAFPCLYDIQVVLLFGQDERMRQQYVHRLRLCP